MLSCILNWLTVRVGDSGDEEVDESRFVPSVLDRSVRYAHGGSDTIEGSIKLAKHNTGRSAMMAFEGSYHGATAGALSLTGGRKYKAGYEPFLSDVVHVPYPYPLHERGNADAENARAVCPMAGDCCGDISCARALERVQAAVEDPDAGTGKPAAIWAEPIQGEGGVVVPPEGFLQGLRDIADDNDVLLVFDEIQSGFGWTGEWWAAEWSDVTPDAMTMAKGIGGAGLPIGAMMYHEQYDTWEPGGHMGTFRGNVPQCAAASRRSTTSGRPARPRRSARRVHL